MSAHALPPFPSDPLPSGTEDRLWATPLGGGASPLHWLRDAPYWLIAAAFHVLLLLLLGTILVLEAPPERPEVRTILTALAPVPEYEPPRPRNIEVRPFTPDRPVTEEHRVERVEHSPTASAPTIAPFPAPVFPLGIGPSAPAAGEILGRPRGPKGGVVAGSESAVEAALRWLVRHQHPDGRWSSAGYHETCDVDAHGGPCGFAPGVAAPTSADHGFEGFDVGVTALALLAFTGYGVTHRDGEDPEFRDAVRRGAQWLLDRQLRCDDPTLSGLIGAPPEGTAEWVYNHAIATLALCDLLFVSGDILRLRRPAEEAVEWCLRAQNPGYGWKYGFRTGKNDTSVTGWMVLALRSARACERVRLLRLPEGALAESLAGALAWIDAATAHASGLTGYESPGDEGSRLLGVHGDPYPFARGLSCMTAVGVLCRIIGGESRRSDAVRLGVAHLEAHPPEWRPTQGKRFATIHFYAWYYGSAALHLAGGRAWDEWSGALKLALVPNQRTGGCADGSWDPLDEWGAAGGRVTSTALATLTLEVLARFAREEE